MRSRASDRPQQYYVLVRRSLAVSAIDLEIVQVAKQPAPIDEESKILKDGHRTTRPGPSEGSFSRPIVTSGYSVCNARDCFRVIEPAAIDQPKLG